MNRSLTITVHFFNPSDQDIPEIKRLVGETFDEAVQFGKLTTRYAGAHEVTSSLGKCQWTDSEISQILNATIVRLRLDGFRARGYRETDTVTWNGWDRITLDSSRPTQTHCGVTIEWTEGGPEITTWGPNGVQLAQGPIPLRAGPLLKPLSVDEGVSALVATIESALSDQPRSST